MKLKINKQVLVISITLILGLLFYVQSHAYFLVSEVVYENSLGIFIIDIFIVAKIGVYLKNPLQQNLIKAEQNGGSNFFTKRPILTHFSSAVFGSILLFTLSVKLLPFLYTEAFGYDGETTVHVYNTYYAVGRHENCGYGFRARLFLIVGGEVCGLNYEMWKTLKPNDLVKLEGKMTWAGIIPYTIVKLKKP